MPQTWVRLPPPAAPLPAAPQDATHGLQAWLVTMAAAVVPLYLSMFRFQVGVLVRLADLLALALIALTLLTSAGVGRAFRRPVVLLLASLVLYILIQGMLMKRLGVSVKEALQLGFVIVVITTVGWHAQRDPVRFMRWFLAACLICMLHTLAVHFAAGIYTRYKHAGDARYIFGVTSAVFLLAWRARGWRLRGPGAAVGWIFLFTLPPLIASLERKGALGVGLIAAALMASATLRLLRLRASVAVLLLGLLVAAVFVFEQQSLADGIRLAEHDNYFVDESAAMWDSNTHRTALLLNGWDIVTHQPWFGSGADSLRQQMAAYFNDLRLANGTHNFFLDNLIKYGVLGASLFFAAIALGLRRVLALSDDPLAAGLLSLYCLFAVFFISDGQAVTVMALLPTFLGLAFNRQPVAEISPRPRPSVPRSFSLPPSGAMP